MKSLVKELRIVPLAIWPIGVLFPAIMCYFFIRAPRAWPISRGEIAFFAYMSILEFAWVIMVGYIYADSRRRGMRHIMWTLLTIFIPFLTGAILYFVLRDPILVPCPKCAARCRSTFVFCPKCGAEISLACPQCKREVDPTWNSCAYCGKELLPETSEVAR
jgi:hypothetical protein